MEKIAGALYDVYCKEVGGVNFQGDPLPTWDEFKSDPTKKKQSNAWIEVARAAFDHCR